ncbi:MAG TPA: hypothetical protein VFX50_11485, partial [Gemmatimonadales bacterium]|nr:hypothetical protein [Gemmatimonadales bacterium]
MPLRGALGALLLAATACAKPQAVPVSTSDAARAERVREVAPFPVLDSTGRAHDVPFLGGWNTPRPQLLDVDR